MYLLGDNEYMDKKIVALCTSRIYDPQVHGYIQIINERLKSENIALMIFMPMFSHFCLNVRLNSMINGAIKSEEIKITPKVCRGLTATNEEAIIPKTSMDILKIRYKPFSFSV